MSYDQHWPEIADNLLYLAKRANDWEDIHWLAAVADCFDGGDFNGAYATLEWRIAVLHDRMGDDILPLVDAIESCVNSKRSRDRNNHPSPYPSLRLKVESIVYGQGVKGV